MATILVLDDVPQAVDAIKKILERAGHEVVGFSDEAEAIDYVKQHPIDLAVLDIVLKNMSGVDVLKQMKGINQTIKAIMLTGYPGLDTASKSLEWGADEYCVKPIDKDELELKVSVVLAQSMPL